MFSETSVSHSVHRRGGWSAYRGSASKRSLPTGGSASRGFGQTPVSAWGEDVCIRGDASSGGHIRNTLCPLTMSTPEW